MRKLCVDENNDITDPNEIMKEIQSFYSKLYDKNPFALGEDHMNIFLSGVNNKKLSFEQKESLDKNLTRELNCLKH